MFLCFYMFLLNCVNIFVYCWEHSRALTRRGRGKAVTGPRLFIPTSAKVGSHDKSGEGGQRCKEWNRAWRAQCLKGGWCSNNTGQRKQPGGCWATCKEKFRAMLNREGLEGSQLCWCATCWAICPQGWGQKGRRWTGSPWPPWSCLALRSEVSKSSQRGRALGEEAGTIRKVIEGMAYHWGNC